MSFAKRSITVIICLLCLPVFLHGVPEVRLKEIASIGGLRDNQLTGIGLVTGLAGRGDSQNSQLLKNAIANLVAHFGFDLNANDVRSRNCAVVMVTATIPPFMRAGERIDVTVSSIGDARGLEGGILMQTPLQAANGTVYALAQGPVIVPSDRTTPKTTGTVTKGAIAERTVVSDFIIENRLTLILKNPDFVTAQAVRTAIRNKFPDLQVTVSDPSSIEIPIPSDRASDAAGFIAELETLTVKPDPSAKVVIDAKSGVIIMGEKVKIGNVAVSYKSTGVSVGNYYNMQSTDNKEQFVIQETVTVADFVATVREIGLSTEMIIEILKSIENAGALYGILVVK